MMASAPEYAPEASLHRNRVVQWLDERFGWEQLVADGRVDTTGQTLAHASTLSKDLKGTLEEDNKVAAAKKVGALIAKICKSKKIDKVVFDRNGYLYHGRVSALAQAAREAGLEF